MSAVTHHRQQKGKSQGVWPERLASLPFVLRASWDASERACIKCLQQAVRVAREEMSWAFQMALMAGIPGWKVDPWGRKDVTALTRLFAARHAYVRCIK
jgi:hypothetical protein